MALNTFKVPKVYADSASPNTIHELRRKGHFVKAAKKGHDSIVNGINKIKQHYIHLTENSINIQNEFKRYKWREDGEGELVVPNVPIAAYNHAADAIRYSISHILNRGQKW